MKIQWGKVAISLTLSARFFQNRKTTWERILVESSCCHLRSSEEKSELFSWELLKWWLILFLMLGMDNKWYGTHIISYHEHIRSLVVGASSSLWEVGQCWGNPYFEHNSWKAETKSTKGKKTFLPRAPVCLQDEVSFRSIANTQV